MLPISLVVDNIFTGGTKKFPNFYLLHWRNSNRQEWVNLLCWWDHDQKSGSEWNNINIAWLQWPYLSTTSNLWYQHAHQPGIFSVAANLESWAGDRNWDAAFEPLKIKVGGVWWIFNSRFGGESNMFHWHELHCILLAINASVFNFSAHKVQFGLEQQNYQQETLSLVVNTGRMAYLLELSWHVDGFWIADILSLLEWMKGFTQTPCIFLFLLKTCVGTKGHVSSSMFQKWSTVFHNLEGSTLLLLLQE